MLVLLTSIAFQPTVADAYVGPGAGLTMLGSLWGLIIAVLFVIFGVLLLPIKLLLNRVRKNRNNEEIEVSDDRYAEAKNINSVNEKTEEN